MSFRRSLFLEHRFNDALTAYSLGEDWEICVRVSRTHDLVLTSTARLQHLNAPGNRLSRPDRLRTMVRNDHLFYRRLYSRSERRRLKMRTALGWFRFGVVVYAAANAKSGDWASARALVNELWRQVRRTS